MKANLIHFKKAFLLSVKVEKVLFLSSNLFKITSEATSLCQAMRSLNFQCIINHKYSKSSVKTSSDKRMSKGLQERTQESF